jgi:hypothetical protein
MNGQEEPTKPLTFPELAELRRRTEIISTLLHGQLTTHLETLRPIFSPERLLGKYAGAKADVPLAERALAQVQKDYKPFTARPYDLPSEMDPYWLTLVGNRVILYPWEYTYQAKTERETKTINMTSPMRWVVSYSSAYTLSQMRQALTGQGERRPEHIRQFVVNALVTQLALSHTPGLGPLFADLRYQVRTDYAADLLKLPLTTITFGLPSFRPADDLILAATSFSGIPAFIELVDTDALAHLQDPLKVRLAELLG